MADFLTQLVIPASGTFFNLPLLREGRHYDIIFFGIPCGIGSLSKKYHPGTGLTTLRNLSRIFPALHRGDPDEFLCKGWYDYTLQDTLLAGASICDAGDFYIDPYLPLDSYSALPGLIRELLSHTKRLIIVAGDHSITYWTMQAFPQGGLVVFDAHEDASTIDGPYPHHANFVSYLELQVSVQSIHQFGLRGIIPDNRRTPTHKRCVVTSQKDLKYAIADGADANCLLSVDWDVVDPTCLSGVNSPMPGGWTFELLVQNIGHVIDNCPKTRVVEFVEYAPKPGDDPAEAMALVFVLLRTADLLFKQMETCAGKQ